MPDITRDDDALRRVLDPSTRIAMVGASTNPARDSNRVFAYLRRAGYDVLPVNPTVDEVHGVKAVPDLAAAKEHWGGIDMVDVFRNPAEVAPIVKESLELGASSIWFQLGVVNPEAIAAAVAGGLDVVVDRCIKIEHARLA